MNDSFSGPRQKGGAGVERAFQARELAAIAIRRLDILRAFDEEARDDIATALADAALEAANYLGAVEAMERAHEQLAKFGVKGPKQVGRAVTTLETALRQEGQ